MAERTVSIRALLEDRLSRGLKAIRGEFGDLEGDVKKVTAGLRPLTTGLARLGTAFLGFQAARGAIAAAEQQTQAEAALLQALRGREDQLRRITEAASELQSRSIIGDEVLIQQASLLINMGVAAERVPEALAAAIDTSAALGVELESVTKAIGLFESGLAGELGERIGELKVLQREGRLAADGIELLTDKFEGAAGAIAETDFGRAQQGLNVIGDQAERLGEVLNRVRTATLNFLVPVLDRVVTLATSSPVRAIVDVLDRVLDRVGGISAGVANIVVALAAIQVGIFLAPAAKILATVIAIGAAVAAPVVALREILSIIPGIDRELALIIASASTLSAAVATIASLYLPRILGLLQAAQGLIARLVVPFALLAAKAALVVTAVTAIVAGILELTGLLDPIVATVRRILDALNRGKLSIRDVGALALRTIGTVGGALFSLIFDPIAAFFSSLADRFVASLELVRLKALEFAKTRQFALSSLPVVGPVFGGTDAAAQDLGDINFEIARVEARINNLPSLGEALEGGLESAIERARAGIAAIGDDLDRRLVAGVEASGVEGAAESAEELARRRASAIRQLFDAATATVEERRFQQAFLEVIGTGFDPDALNQLIDSIPERLRDGIRDIPTAIATVLSTLPTEIQDTGRELVLRTLEEQARKEQITRTELLQVREAVEQDVIRREVTAREEILRQRREELKVAEQRGASELEILDAVQRVAAAQEALFESDVRLADIQSQAFARRREEAEAVAGAGRQIAEELTSAAQVEFEALGRGIRSIADVEARLLENTEKADERLEALRAEIVALGEGGAIASTDVDALVDSIERAREAATEEVALGFAEALTQKVETAAARVDALRASIERARGEGIIPAEEIRQLEAAEQALSRVSSEALTTLDGLREIVPPELLPLLDQLIARVQSLREETGSTFSFGTFLTGAQEGFRRTAEDLSNLGRVGVQVGAQLAGTIGDVFVDLLQQGGRNIRDLASKFLAAVSAMIARAVILKLVMASLGPAGVGLFGASEGGEVPALRRGGRVQRLIEGGAVIRERAGQFVGRAAAMALGLVGAFAGGAVADVPRYAEGGGVAHLERFVESPVVRSFVAFHEARSRVQRFAGGGKTLPVIGDPGGHVPGPKINRDIVPALLTPEEWVIRRASALYYGPKIMDALNRAAIPRTMLEGVLTGPDRVVIANTTARFQSGGQVPAATAATSRPASQSELRDQTPGLSRTVLVGGEQEFDRLVSGGESVLDRWFDRNAAKLGAILRAKGVI